MLPPRLPARRAEPRHVSVESLNVSPRLVGQPLATPARRALAMGIDLLAVALLASAGGYLLALALLVLAWQVRGALRSEGARALASGLVAGLLVAAASYAAWDAWSQRAGLRTARLERAEERIEALRSAAPAASGVAGTPPTDAERVARLQAENEVLRRALEAPRGVKARVDEFVDELGLSFGWGIVYFSLLPAWWQGQTLGKRLARLRIVELTGRPITPLRALKRYGGYAAGLATGGLGFLQILWEPNRQGLHDKAAHTVVVEIGRAAPPWDTRA